LCIQEIHHVLLFIFFKSSSVKEVNGYYDKCMENIQIDIGIQPMIKSCLLRLLTGIILELGSPENQKQAKISLGLLVEILNGKFLTEFLRPLGSSYSIDCRVE
jgi:hypothetical protein